MLAHCGRLREGCLLPYATMTRVDCSGGNRGLPVGHVSRKSNVAKADNPHPPAFSALE